VTYIHFKNYLDQKSTKSINHIIYILCESCWYDKHFFGYLFNPLLKEEFIALRGVSPAYGGGTANAEFEMLTALPSSIHLDGIIYQEYTHLVSDQTQTVITALKEKGYSTLALHNYINYFWKRNVILPKLGFQRFISIEEMDCHDTSWPPSDRFLYDKTLKEFSVIKNRPAFLSLVTMFTHGGYAEYNDDLGVGDYKNRLKQAIVDMAMFIHQIKALDPNVFIVIYGDHKPPLPEFFHQNHIVDEKNERKQEVIGDVPVFIYHSDKKLLKKLAFELNHKPFYCISAILDQKILHSGAAVTRYMYKNICLQHHLAYKKRIQLVPSWLYYWSLFAKKEEKNEINVDPPQILA
jgi:phosphoglycerol transferase MdoB-like AlkP superfamily enzyme